MEVLIADYSGFCFGVERAIDLVLDRAKVSDCIATYGPIIHNPQVVENLENQGIKVVTSLSDINKNLNVVIRSHGVEKTVKESIVQQAGEVTDATCPFVLKAQKHAEDFSKECSAVVILGEKDHPEVRGIVSYSTWECFVVAGVEEAQDLPYRKKYGFLAQTTQNNEIFQKISVILRGKCEELKTANTICSATSRRQQASVALAKQVEVMVVVGGKNSANTTRLYHLCKEICPRTYHIETPQELTNTMFQGVSRVGLTAGASTPKNFVSKVREYILRGQQMSEENKNREEMMEDLEALLEESLKPPQRGDIVEGTVVQIKGDEVLVNFGYKTEGVVSRSEFDADLKEGDTVELAVISFAGGSYVQLSRKTLNERSDWDSIKNASASGEPVQVKILSHVEKGYTGKFGEIDAFIPDNHIDLRVKNADPKDYIGKTLPAKVLKFGGKKKSALVSPRLYLLEESQRQKADFFSNINVGDVIKGTVKTIKEYGAFISFGLVDGFLHKNDINWGRVKTPAKFLAQGDEVEVEVLEIKLDDGKIAVGMKQLLPDPWNNAAEKYPVGESVKGTIITRKRAGYVLEIEQGIDGFIPNDELSWLKNARTTLNVKDVVEGRVLAYDDERKRVVMSVKDLSDNPWTILKAEQPVGSIVKGKIKNITDFGIFVDFGSFIDGLVRKGDISWTDEPGDLNEAYKVGDEIEAKILHIDEDKERISLGIKQLEANPWKELGKLLPSGKVVEAPIINITKQGLEVELPLKMKGIIAIADLDPANPSLEQFNVGDTITAQVIKTDSKEKQVILSVKKYLQDSERRETREYMKKMADNDNAFSFGSIFKDKLGKQD